MLTRGMSQQQRCTAVFDCIKCALAWGGGRCIHCSTYRIDTCTVSMSIGNPVARQQTHTSIERSAEQREGEREGEREMLTRGVSQQQRCTAVSDCIKCALAWGGEPCIHCSTYRIDTCTVSMSIVNPVARQQTHTSIDRSDQQRERERERER